MRLDRHWWKTGDGRLVPDGDPDAAVLAYPRFTEIPDDTARRLGITADDGDEPDETKAKPAAANKARSKSANK